MPDTQSQDIDVRRTMHTLVIRKSTSNRFPYEVICTCQWQALAHSEENAEYLQQCHQKAQAYLVATGGMPMVR